MKVQLSEKTRLALPELLVMRHGETEWNVQGRWQGQLDSPLTALGRKQAGDQGELLRLAGVTAESHAFICSPQLRAMKTAEIALSGVNAVAAVDDRLAEIDVGEWTGQKRDHLRAANPTHDTANWLELYAAAPGGETFDSIWARVVAVLEIITGPTVIISHGVTTRFLRAAALGQGLDAAADMPGRQGVIPVIRNGYQSQL